MAKIKLGYLWNRANDTKDNEDNLIGTIADKVLYKYKQNNTDKYKTVQSKLDELESNKANNGESLADYGIADAYTKGECDTTVSNILRNDASKDFITGLINAGTANRALTADKATIAETANKLVDGYKAPETAHADIADNATTADKLTIGNIGSSSQTVYFDGGVPVAGRSITYGTSEPSGGSAGDIYIKYI